MGVVLQAQLAAVQHDDAREPELFDIALQLPVAGTARLEAGQRGALRQGAHRRAARDDPRRVQAVPVGEAELALGLRPRGHRTPRQVLRVDLAGCHPCGGAGQQQAPHAHAPGVVWQQPHE